MILEKIYSKKEIITMIIDYVELGTKSKLYANLDKRIQGIIKRKQIGFTINGDYYKQCNAEQARKHVLIGKEVKYFVPFRDKADLDEELIKEVSGVLEDKVAKRKARREKRKAKKEEKESVTPDAKPEAIPDEPRPEPKLDEPRTKSSAPKEPRRRPRPTKENK